MSDFARKDVGIANHGQGHILITRPAHQAAELQALLEDGGARVSICPTIEIVDRTHDEALSDKVRDIAQYDVLIFISRNAIDYGKRVFDKVGVQPEAAPPAAAVGLSTARGLSDLGFNVIAFPDVPSSENLLATPAMQALKTDARVLIFRGRGGKEVLATKLRERGMSVEYAEVYERVRPAGTTFDMNRLAPDVILVGSRDSLDNLYEMTTPQSRERLLATPAVLGAAGMVERHKALGFIAAPIVADSPLDADMAQTALAFIGAQVRGE